MMQTDKAVQAKEVEEPTVRIRLPIHSKHFRAVFDERYAAYAAAAKAVYEMVGHWLPCSGGDAEPEQVLEVLGDRVRRIHTIECVPHHGDPDAIWFDRGCAYGNDDDGDFIREMVNWDLYPDDPPVQVVVKEGTPQDDVVRVLEKALNTAKFNLKRHAAKLAATTPPEPAPPRRRARQARHTSRDPIARTSPIPQPGGAARPRKRRPSGRQA